MFTDEVRRITSFRSHPFETALQADEIRILKESLKNLTSEEARYSALSNQWLWIKSALKKADVEQRYTRWRARSQAFTGRYCSPKKEGHDNFVAFWVSKVGGVSSIAKILGVTPAAVSTWCEKGRFPPAQALVLGDFFHCPHFLFDWDSFRHQAGCPSMPDLRDYFGYTGSRSYEKRKRLVKSKAV